MDSTIKKIKIKNNNFLWKPADIKRTSIHSYPSPKTSHSAHTPSSEITQEKYYPGSQTFLPEAKNL
jgi:hypothetical protein